MRPYDPGQADKTVRREDILPKRIKVETMDEIDKMKAARIRTGNRGGLRPGQ
jgi:hypothetical protein